MTAGLNSISKISQTKSCVSVLVIEITILSKAHHKFEEPIEPVGLTPEQVRENKGFIREIINTGIIVYND